MSPRKRKESDESPVQAPELTGSEHLPVALESKHLPTAPSSTHGDQGLLTRYLQEAGRVPLLSPEEEKELALRVYNAREGITPPDPEALKKLVAANLRFVVKIAFEYSRYGAKVLDLVQEGNVGLIKAVQDFNPYKDVRLTTYAVYWIRSYIQDYLLRNWSLVRLGTTASQKKLFYRLKKEQEKFEREGMTASTKAIAMNLDVDESDVKMMQERMSGRDVSLSNPPPGDNENTVNSFEKKAVDTSPLPSSTLEASEQAALFQKALEEFKDELEERDLEIFQDRLLSENPATLQEIGDRYGFSKERARQIEERLKKKLKEFLATYYPDISLN